MSKQAFTSDFPRWLQWYIERLEKMISGNQALYTTKDTRQGNHLFQVVFSKDNKKYLEFLEALEFLFLKPIVPQNKESAKGESATTSTPMDIDAVIEDIGQDEEPHGQFYFDEEPQMASLLELGEGYVAFPWINQHTVQVAVHRHGDERCVQVFFIQDGRQPWQN